MNYLMLPAAFSFFADLRDPWERGNWETKTPDYDAISLLSAFLFPAGNERVDS